MAPSAFDNRLDPFRIEVRGEGGAARVIPVGDVDISTVEQISHRLDELYAAGFRRFILDLRRLTFMDSSGLRLILAWNTRSREDGIELALIEGPHAIQRVFEISGVLEELPFKAA